jgi:hypothetical protein
LIWSQNRDRQKIGFLVFPMILGVTVIHHQNADAIVLANASMRGIHPPDNIRNGGRPGGECLS